MLIRHSVSQVTTPTCSCALVKNAIQLALHVPKNSQTHAKPATQASSLCTTPSALSVVRKATSQIRRLICVALAILLAQLVIRRHLNALLANLVHFSKIINALASVQTASTEIMKTTAVINALQLADCVMDLYQIIAIHAHQDSSTSICRRPVLLNAPPDTTKILRSKVVSHAQMDAELVREAHHLAQAA